MDWRSRAVVAAILLLPVVMGGTALLRRYYDDGARCAGTDSESVIAACTKLIRSQRTSKENVPRAFNNRGNAYNNKGQYDLAIEDLSRAIELKPDYVLAFANRGRAYALKGLYDRAIEDFSQAIKFKPDYARAVGERGDAYALNGQYDQAIQDYDQAIRLNRNSADTFAARGDVLKRKGQYDRAIRDYDEAIRLKPDYPEAFASRGLALFGVGRFEAAADDFAAAAKLKPTYAYWALWHYLSRVKANDTDTVELARAAARLDLGKWPGAVVWLYLGKATKEQVHVAAATGADEKTRTEQACEAAFYVAEYGLSVRRDVEGPDEQAADRTLLREAAETCPPGFIEREGAIAELNRLTNGLL